MKWYGVSASLLILAAMLHAGRSASRERTPTSSTPVLVELFTSEGCSSCPPADQVLAQLDRQPVAGAEIIAMSEHVDYWDSLGWKDPFSAATFTDRQNGYAQALGNKDIYTPQMIVDGQTELLGNDAAEAIEAVAGASRRSKAAVSINIISADASSAKVHVQMNSLADLVRGDQADVYLAITENNLSTDVARGENKGQKLTHVAVVRFLKVIGHVTPDRTFSADSVVRILDSWKRNDLQVIAFVQTNKKRHVLALSRTPL
jgi:hypothetical protein